MISSPPMPRKKKPKPDPVRSLFDLLMCRNCGLGIATRPRKLCRKCYDHKATRDQNPSTDRSAARGVPDRTGVPPLDPKTTDAKPGSPEKIAVLIGRCGKYRLFHPKDRRL